MNYEEMSEHAISSKILESKVIEMGFTANIRPTLPHKAGSTNAYCGNTLENFDINNPADMWPIIVDNGISLLQQDNEEGWCAFRWDDDNAECWHKNPLRAAAIVFLMMKDAEKVK